MARICIFGAGSIGCYVGGRLAAAGADVVFIGRPRIASSVAVHGLKLSDYLGYKASIAAEAINFSTEASAAADADLVLVTVKSAASAEAAAQLREHLKPQALVLSFQNGLGNAEILANGLPEHKVLAGMVPFNVINRGDGAFHQGTEGQLDTAADAALAPHLADFERAGLPILQHQDMLGVQWAKLLLNLNNAVNALSGLPLKAQLSERDYRRCLAMAQMEALDLLADEPLELAKLTPLPPRLLPKLLRVPNTLFKLLANRMLAIDPLARSSMWEDLEAGRLTEIEQLNGEVVALAQRQGKHAPINALMCKLVHEAEQGGRRDWPAKELLTLLRKAS